MNKSHDSIDFYLEMHQMPWFEQKRNSRVDKFPCRFKFE